MHIATGLDPTKPLKLTNYQRQVDPTSRLVSFQRLAKKYADEVRVVTL